jgi:hypothetical protein
MLASPRSWPPFQGLPSRRWAPPGPVSPQSDGQQGAYFGLLPVNQHVDSRDAQAAAHSQLAQAKAAAAWQVSRLPPLASPDHARAASLFVKSASTMWCVLSLGPSVGHWRRAWGPHRPCRHAHRDTGDGGWADAVKSGQRAVVRLLSMEQQGAENGRGPRQKEA